MKRHTITNAATISSETILHILDTNGFNIRATIGYAWSPDQQHCEFTQPPEHNDQNGIKPPRVPVSASPYAMVPIHRWEQDSTGLSWYRGFYLPVPVDINEHDKLGYTTMPEVQAYIKKHPEQFTNHKSDTQKTERSQTTTTQTETTQK